MADRITKKNDSGVRKYLRRTPAQRINQWWVGRRLGHIGDDVFIGRNIQFQRFPANITIGSHVIVKEGVRICSAQPDAVIDIGDWTTVGHHTFIFASRGISIGTNCLIAPFCYLIDSNHGIKRDQLIRNQKMSSSKVSIGDDVWLGCGVRVLRGVTINNGVVVGAGSVVTEDIPAFKIVMGNPAEIVGERL